MRPDSRSVSFTFHREVLTDRNSPQVSRTRKNLRQRLQDRFDKEKNNDGNTKDKAAINKNTSEKSWNNLSLGTMSADSRRAFRNGAEKLSKTISSVRTTFGTISQKFRSSTRRRQILDEQQSPGACNSQTPQSRSRNLLGRTPTKLYSPFGIESPRHAWDKENDSATLSDSSKKTSMIREPCRPFRFIKSRGFAALR
ncbi:hypothetical protein PV325_009625 [Microctonus aethiopoides]|uniref:Uncharacterized protein n=1 Tax=Microctonus aethiopoides TaxID=144406 RepID=A0AA39KWD4_9HYME|nr:hypothetical protein PV325_009625 [Microctonus aethiopoides]KAK0094388.1 hypothetical protein PV326_011061 [Microctonus aethiopoides]KAK0176142.1 hypothetical protein PV328_000310 [Microctonus aethiopoides]